MTGTVRLTVAQAVVRFLAAQRSERDGIEHPFFGGCSGIFGHGNVAASARRCWTESPPMRCATTRPGTSRPWCTRGRLRADAQPAVGLGLHLVGGPGRDEHGHGAALATINRLPVLLLPGDVFATGSPCCPAGTGAPRLAMS